MQTQHGATAEGAILASERSFRPRLLADWNNNGLFDHPLSDLGPYVESIGTDRNLAGSMPAEVLLIEGAASGEMDVTLHGAFAGQNIASVFSAYNTASPMYQVQTVGVEIVYEIGVETPLGTMWYPQFIGLVRTTSPDRSNGTVVLSCLDRAELMRAPIRFPGWATAGNDVTDLTASGQNAGLVGVINKLSQLTDTSWVIDHCLRHCDTSPTPWRPTYDSEISTDPAGTEKTQVWISGSGSHLPTVGWSSRSNEAEYPSLDGTGLVMYERHNEVHPDSPEPLNRPFNLASIAGTFGDFRCNSVDMMSIPTRGTHYMSMTVILDGQNALDWRTVGELRFVQYIGGLTAFEVRLDGGDIQISMEPVNNFGEPNGPEQVSQTLAIPNDGRNTARLTCVLNTDPGFSGVTANIICDEFTTGVHTIYSGDWWAAGPLPIDEILGYTIVEPEVGFADFTCVNRLSGPGASMTAPGINAGSPAKHAAVLDPGLQQLSHLPTRLGDDAWSVVTDVAAAETGAVFWDEAGVFHFWNYETVLALRSGGAARSYTLDHFEGLTFTNTLDSVRNVWSITASKAVARLGSIFESRNINEFVVPSNTTTEFVLWNESAIGHIQFDLVQVSAETFLSGDLQPWLDQAKHGYAVTFQQGTHPNGDDRWVEDAGLAGSVNARAHLDEEGHIVLVVENGSSDTLRLASPTEDATGQIKGRPTVVIGGSFVDPLDSIVTTLETIASRESAARYGPRNLKVSGDWVQDTYSLTAATDVLMPPMLTPTPVTDDIVVPGDPRLQLGDCVTVNDRYGFGQDIKLQVYGIHREFNKDGLTDTLKVELTNPPAVSDVPVVLVVDPDGSFDPPA